ncbi:LmbE-like protein, partial [Dacryopinax primogenitus]
ALLLTAHPDDESMFFAPTLLSLITAGWEVWILCLSVGDAQGLGEVRRAEIGDAAEELGIGRGRVNVLHDTRLPDSMSVSWSSDVILEHLNAFLHEHDNVTLLLTFDTLGVSGHVNHASLPLALHSALPPAYTLLSSPLWNKYTSLISYFLPLHPTPSARYSLFPSEYVKALRVMRKHKSQMVWFRWLWITFSRYMWVNEFLPLSP